MCGKDIKYLEKLHEVEIEILDVIVTICKKHSIPYFLVGGTLIGAVRHKGFIPWDDDIDIGMKREDYERFLEVASTELPEEYFLQSYLTDSTYVRSFAKIRKNGTLFQEQSNPNAYGEHLGIYVDIFPFDYAKKAFGIQKIQKIVLNKLLAVQQIKYKYANNGKMKYYISKIFPSKLNHFLQQQIMKILKKGDYLINLSSPYGTEKETIPVAWFFPTTEMEFCGKTYSVPGNYDAVLRHIFGDYMILPPEEKRIAHSPIKICFDISKEK